MEKDTQQKRITHLPDVRNREARVYKGLPEVFPNPIARHQPEIQLNKEVSTGSKAFPHLGDHDTFR